VAFPRRLLTEGEALVADVHPHWSFLGWTAIAVVVPVAALVALSVAWPAAPLVVAWILGAILALSMAWFAGRLVRWRSTQLVVTSSRVVQRSGVLGRRGLEVRLTRINEISYHQSILERLTGQGRLFLDVGGDRGVVAFNHVPRPAALAAVIHEQIEDPGMSRQSSPGAADPAGERRGSDARHHPPPGRDDTEDTPPSGTSTAAIAAHSAGGSDRSAARRLIELDELRRRGILSEQEFAERRARLLDQL